MRIVLKNMKPGRILTSKGVDVDVEFTNASQANLMIALSIEDGTHFFFPTALGKKQSTRIPPGDYICALTMRVLNASKFGRTYKGSVVINGTTIATVDGAVPDNSDGEDDFKTFTLRVT